MAQRAKGRLEKSQAAYRRLAAQHAATLALITDRETCEVITSGLQAVGEALHWSEAAFWWLDRDKQVLRCEEFWRWSTARSSEFESMTRMITFERGIGLPGRVWKTGAAAWIPDVLKDRNFPRASSA